MKEVYDQKRAESYDKYYDTAEGHIVGRIEEETIYSCLEPRTGLKLLDIGCGTGRYSISLASMGLEVTGVDVSPAMLEKAQAKATEAGVSISFMGADALRLPFDDETFDLVLSVDSMEWVPDFRAALQEAFRVLKTGGRFVVGFIGRDSAWWRFYTEEARRKPDTPFGYARFYTLGELLAAMPGQGIRGKAAVFVPPDFDFSQEEKVMAIETEAINSGRTDGRFVCAVSIK
ncbi:demethylrebeccamycin-D-glucose O-methyltransferase [Peptococcaceae bacterium CEB3]|nr:demethylrebeccamycin-D-glucose O-methyltransferase [Peptococcaceae bacterium CEB3]